MRQQKDDGGWVTQNEEQADVLERRDTAQGTLYKAIKTAQVMPHGGASRRPYGSADSHDIMMVGF